MTELYFWLDATLIFFFRLSDIPILGYYLGCAVLALVCVVLGQLTIGFAFKMNRRFIERDNHDMVHMHNLSVKALLAKDKGAYRSINKQANDAFGKVFFSQIALAISGLWPIPFALEWMQTRFMDVRFELPVSLPVIGNQVGFIFTFLPIYILIYLLFIKAKRRLPFFRGISATLDRYQNQDGEEMIRFSDMQPGSSVDAKAESGRV